MWEGEGPSYLGTEKNKVTHICSKYTEWKVEKGRSVREDMETDQKVTQESQNK